jgi:hypothetical protein
LLLVARIVCKICLVPTATYRDNCSSKWPWLILMQSNSL